MLIKNQSSFALFKRLKQPLDTSQPITTTEIVQTEIKLKQFRQRVGLRPSRHEFKKLPN